MSKVTTGSPDGCGVRASDEVSTVSRSWTRLLGLSMPELVDAAHCVTGRASANTLPTVSSEAWQDLMAVLWTEWKCTDGERLQYLLQSQGCYVHGRLLLICQMW